MTQALRNRVSLHSGRFLELKLCFAVTLVIVLTVGASALHAQGRQPVQVLAGSIMPGEFSYYRLDDLNAGDTLYAYLDERSGNLDPAMGILEGNQDVEALLTEYRAALQTEIERGTEPLEAWRNVLEQVTLAADDDSGEGLAASLTFEVPEDGEYGLIVAGALSTLGVSTWGEYQLIVGLNAPEVLTGEAESTGDEIAVLDRDAAPYGIRIEETSGTITDDVSEVTYELTEAQIGDTVYAYVEAQSGDLRPALILSNYADKPVVAANANGADSSATLSHTFEESARNFTLRVVGCCQDQPTTGEYRLLLGVNAPEVLEGSAAPAGEGIIQKPVEVQIGVKLQQMVDINEASEFYNAVYSLQMEWMDPEAAFSPDTCDCTFKAFTQGNFSEFLEAVGGRWPEFTIFNQQGNRWSQNKVGIIFSDGRVIYFERFTTNLQVDFDFTKYPFDRQEFSLKIDGVYPDDVFVFTDLPDYTEIEPDHGEDEFLITDWQTDISSVQASTRSNVSRFTFRFDAPRQLEYYALQIFIPVALIIIVSYVTFFLRDYGRRIEVASANLLLFIAFSFSLADNYPRLGYVTFLDALMAMIFVINALVVIYNVWLRKMEMAGDVAHAERIDSILDWAYPIAYLLAIFGLYLWFFVR